MAPPGSPTPPPLKPGSTPKPRARTVKDRSTGTVPPNPEQSDTVRENLNAPAPFTKKEQQQASDVAGIYTLVGVLTGAVRKDIGEQIVENSQEAADAWVTLGQRNPRVKAAIDSMTSASVWAAVLAVHMRMLAPAISIPVMARSKPEEPTQSPVDMERWMADNGFTPDPAAMELAMQMMAGQQPRGNGGPTDTVSVKTDGNGHPVGSAEYQAPPMDPASYPFPMDSGPPRGRDGE